MINYHDKRFRAVANSDNGEVTEDLVFHYQQLGGILSCIYESEHIIKGQLIGLVDKDGSIDMRYQQVNREGKLRTGICHSTPEILPNGKIRLHESWEWTSGDRSKGNSVLEEL